MLKIDFTNLSYDPKWYEFRDPAGNAVEGVRLKIRPYPLSQASFALRDGDLVFSQAEQCKMFRYALVGWDGVVGADGLPLPCIDEVKQKVFDFDLGGIPGFVLGKLREFRETLDKTEKNS